MRKDLKLLFPMLLMLPGCVPSVGGRPILSAQNVGCSDLVKEWMKPVDGAAIPTGRTIADLAIYGDEQTGRLDMANDRIVNGHATISRCEQRDRAATAPKGFFDRLLG